MANTWGVTVLTCFILPHTLKKQRCSRYLQVLWIQQVAQAQIITKKSDRNVYHSGLASMNFAVPATRTSHKNSENMQSSSIEPLLQITCGDPPKACLIVSMPSLSAYSLPFETCIPPLDNISGNPFNPNLRQRKDKVPWWYYGCRHYFLKTMLVERRWFRLAKTQWLWYDYLTNLSKTQVLTVMLYLK